MAYNRIHAQRLCDPAEYDVFVGSLSDTIATLTAVQLRAKVNRARILRNKFADALKPQAGSVPKPPGAAASPTEQKLAMFEEALKRFETRLEKLEAISGATTA